MVSFDLKGLGRVIQNLDSARLICLNPHGCVVRADVAK
jgi:hypothetical protein